MRFDGLDPWPTGREVIECEVGTTFFDLHNLASFAGLVWNVPDTLTVRVDYDPRRWSDRGPPGADRRMLIELTFTEVREWQARQAVDFAVEASDAIDGWQYWDRGTRGKVELLAGDATISFTASAVKFRAEPWHGPAQSPR